MWPCRFGSVFGQQEVIPSVGGEDRWVFGDVRGFEEALPALGEELSEGHPGHLQVEDLKFSMVRFLTMFNGFIKILKTILQEVTWGAWCGAVSGDEVVEVVGAGGRQGGHYGWDVTTN